MRAGRQTIRNSNRSNKEKGKEDGTGLGACTVPAEDPHSVPRSHARELPASCNSSSRRSGALFWTPGAPALTVQIPAQTHRNIHKFK